MLGRQRRTTRLDVGLAIAFAGLSYLVWSLVAGGSRVLVRTFMHSAENLDMELSDLTGGVKIFFSEAGFVIDLVGLAWLAGSLALVLLSSRQRIGITWVWVCAICQSFTAALGAVLVGLAVLDAMAKAAGGGEPKENILERISEISLPVVITLAVLIWVSAVVWLLVERAHFANRGPTLRDGLRTNVFKV